MSPRNKIQNEAAREASISRIMETCFRLFAHQGYHATSVSQIAREAGISKGLIYNYYPSKEALLHGLFEYFGEEEQQMMGQIVDEDPRKFLENLFEVVFEQIRTRQEFWKLTMSMALQADMYPFIHDMAITKMKKYFDLLGNLLEQTGLENPYEEARLLSATMDGIMIHYMTVGEDYPMDQVKLSLIEKYCS